MNNNNPQDIADFLIANERKYIAGAREDIEEALHLSAVVLEELQALAVDLSRTWPMRKADESRIKGLVGFIQRLTAQLIAISRQTSAAATSTQLWQALTSRSNEKNQPNGLVKRSNH